MGLLTLCRDAVSVFCSPTPADLAGDNLSLKVETNEKLKCGLVSLFNGMSTFWRLLNAKAILFRRTAVDYLTHRGEDKGVHSFSKAICPKLNVITRLEFELAPLQCHSPAS